MNSSSYSVQHSTLLATGQVCCARNCVRVVARAVHATALAVCVVVSVAHAAPPLVRALMHVPRPIVRAFSALSHTQA